MTMGVLYAKILDTSKPITLTLFCLRLGSMKGQYLCALCQLDLVLVLGTQL